MLKPDQEVMQNIEQENGLPTQAEFTLVGVENETALMYAILVTTKFQRQSTSEKI